MFHGTIDKPSTKDVQCGPISPSYIVRDVKRRSHILAPGKSLPINALWQMSHFPLAAKGDVTLSVDNGANEQHL